MRAGSDGEARVDREEMLLWFSGYYHGKRNDTIVEPEAVKQNEEKLNRYCYEHRDTTVMDAVKNVLGWDK